LGYGKWLKKVKMYRKGMPKGSQKGSKMETKCVQKSSKIDVKIEVGKKSEKRDAPARFRSVAGQWIFGQKRSEKVSEK